MTDYGLNYYSAPSGTRLIWSIPKGVDNDDTDFDLSIICRKPTGGGDVVVSAGLVCYAAAEVVGAASAGTFQPVLFDNATISATTDTLTEVTVSIANGDLPAGTKNVAVLLKIENAETLLIKHFEIDRAPLVQGNRIRTVETITTDSATKITTLESVYGGTISSASVENYTRTQANAAFAASTWATNLAAVFGANAANAEVNIQTIADGQFTSSTMFTNLTSAFGTNAADALSVIDTRADAQIAASTIVTNLEVAFGSNAASLATGAMTLSGTTYSASTIFDNLEAVFGSNAASIESYVNTRADAQLAASTIVTNLESAFGGNAANALTVIDTRANDEIASSTIAFSTDANGGAASLTLTSSTGSTSTSGAIKLSADQIVVAAGAALFQVLSDRVKQNVPLEIDLGTGSNNTFVLRPNASTILWIGPRGTTLANMTTANNATVFAIPISGSTVTYQGEDLVSGGGGTFSRTLIKAISGTSTVYSDEVALTANGVSGGIKFAVKVDLTGVRTPFTPTGSDPTVGDDLALSVPDITMTIERSINGGSTWSNLFSPTNLTGTISRKWLYYDPNFDYGSWSDSITHRIQETSRLNKTFSNSATGTNGTAFLFRLKFAVNSWPASHTVSGSMQFTVEQVAS